MPVAAPSRTGAPEKEIYPNMFDKSSDLIYGNSTKKESLLTG
jgi:hypothetical protein